MKSLLNLGVSIYTDMKRSEPSKGYGVFYLALLWAASYIVSLFVLKESNPGKVAAIVAAVVPAVLFAWCVFSVIKSAANMDEVEVRIQMEAAVLAFALSFILIMTLGLLDLAVELNKEDWGYRHLVPYFMVFYLFGLFMARRKYSGDEE